MLLEGNWAERAMFRGDVVVDRWSGDRRGVEILLMCRNIFFVCIYIYIVKLWCGAVLCD